MLGTTAMTIVIRIVDVDCSLLRKGDLTNAIDVTHNM
jgi:hypothetical protein